MHWSNNSSLPDTLVEHLLSEERVSEITLLREASNSTGRQALTLSALRIQHGKEAFSRMAFVSSMPDFLQACNYAEKLAKRFSRNFGVINTHINLLIETNGKTSYRFWDTWDNWSQEPRQPDFIAYAPTAPSSTPKEIEFDKDMEVILEAMEKNSAEDAAVAIEEAFKDSMELSRLALRNEVKAMKEGRDKDEYIVNADDQARHILLQRQVGKEVTPEWDKPSPLSKEEWRAYAKKGMIQRGSMAYAVALGKERVTMTGRHGDQMRRYGVKRPEFVCIAKHRVRKDWWVLDERMPTIDSLKMWEPMEIIWWAGHANYRDEKVSALKHFGMYFEDGFVDRGYLRKEEDAFYRQPISAQLAEVPRYHVEILDKSTGEMIGRTVYANSGTSAEKKVRKTLIDAGLYHCETQDVRQADADSLSSVTIDQYENLVTDDYESEVDLESLGLDLFEVK